MSISVDPVSRTITASLDASLPGSSHFLGAQIYDPDTGTFIFEGPWVRLGEELRIEMPSEKGRYHVYISAIENGERWLYDRGKPFLLIESEVEHGRLTTTTHSITTLAKLRTRKRLNSIKAVFTGPFRVPVRNFALVRSLVRRDVLARYRGSFGGVAWTVLHPLLLMATYFFVFGVVLQSRIGADTSRSAYALFFLAGMLPWLAFSETIGRSPHSIVEHRNFVKKLIFPVEIVPVVHTIAGLATSAFALLVFILALGFIRQAIPAAALALPLVLIPQALFTLGLAWCLSALGVFFRDLTQIMGFVLTLVFFLTPICYPESALPPAAASILTASPIYGFVRGYRQLLLDGTIPSIREIAILFAFGLGACFLGYAVFVKLRRSFADVI